MASYRIVVRAGPRVERERLDALDSALERVSAHARTLAQGPKRQPIDTRLRSYEPIQQVAARIELRGPRGLNAGIDVRGDGSMEAFTGRVRRNVVEPERGEDAPQALRRVLRA